MRTVALRHLATIMNSNVDKLSDANELPVRLCNYVDVYKNDGIVADLDYMSATATPAEIEKFRLHVGDVIITKDSEDRHDIAVPAFVSQSAPDLICGYHLTIVRARNEIALGEFLFWALQSKIAREYFANAAGGVTRFGLTLDGIKSAPIPLPDRETQRAIADFLDRETARIDQLVEKKQALVDRLPEKEKAKISALVLRGTDGGAPLRDSGVDWRGQVPAHWEESRLKAHFRPAKRQGYDDLEVLSVYREFGVIEKASRDDNINKTPDDLSKYQLVEPGDLVINKMKAWQGSLGISTFRGITSPDYVVMTRTGDHHPLYMHHLLRAQPMPTVYHLISNGIRTDQWRLEPEKFRMLPVFLPPRPEQKAIADLVERELGKLREVSEVILQSIDRLREYRAALITAAVTGQIDISEHTRKGDTDRRLDAIEAEMRA